MPAVKCKVVTPKREFEFEFENKSDIAKALIEAGLTDKYSWIPFFDEDSYKQVLKNMYPPIEFPVGYKALIYVTSDPVSNPWIELPPKFRPKKEAKKSYQIWVGYYHMGQGSHPPKGPELIATVEAHSFKEACFKYELSSKLQHLESRSGDLNDQDFVWNYNPHTNSNSWLGPYFETKEEAQKTFK